MKKKIAHFILLFPIVLFAQDEKRNILKFSFLSPVTNKIQLAYEHSLKPGISLQTDFGYIGIGSENIFSGYAENASGGFLKFGVKFYPGWDKRLSKSDDPIYNMAGWFIKPTFVSSIFTVKENVSYPNYCQYGGVCSYTREDVSFNNSSFGLLLEGGYQFILFNAFTVEFIAGLGYSISGINVSNSSIASPPYYYGNYQSNYKFSHLASANGDGTGLAITAGINLGYYF